MEVSPSGMLLPKSAIEEDDEGNGEADIVPQAGLLRPHSSPTEMLSPEDLLIPLAGTSSDLHVFTLAEPKAATQGFSASDFLGPVYRWLIHGNVEPGLQAHAVAVKFLDWPVTMTTAASAASHSV